MTRNEVVDLLSVITAYDNRNATNATVLAWTKAAEIGRWEPAEALEAVHAHFAESTEFLMPAHITQRIRREKRQPAPIDDEKRGELPAGGPADPQLRARVMAQFRDFMAKRSIDREAG